VRAIKPIAEGKFLSVRYDLGDVNPALALCRCGAQVSSA